MVWIPGWKGSPKGVYAKSKCMPKRSNSLFLSRNFILILLTSQKTNQGKKIKFLRERNHVFNTKFMPHAPWTDDAHVLRSRQNTAIFWANRYFFYAQVCQYQVTIGSHCAGDAWKKLFSLQATCCGQQLWLRKVLATKPEWWLRMRRLKSELPFSLDLNVNKHRSVTQPTGHWLISTTNQ